MSSSSWPFNITILCQGQLQENTAESEGLQGAAGGEDHGVRGPAGPAAGKTGVREPAAPAGDEDHGVVRPAGEGAGQDHGADSWRACWGSCRRRLKSEGVLLQLEDKTMESVDPLGQLQKTLESVDLRGQLEEKSVEPEGLQGQLLPFLHLKIQRHTLESQ